MVEYIDIHSHLLPGIDDGAKDVETSMQMFRMAYRSGITHMILTPHYKPMRHNAGPRRLTEMIKEARERLADEGIEIQLYAGNEMYYHSEVPTILEEGKACSMAGSQYVLVEFSPMDDFDYIRNGVYQIMTGGFRPILAHAERYQCITSKPQRIEELVRMGCYIQLNAGSVTGGYGFGTKQFCKKMLKQQLVHFIASDAHDIKNRTPQLSECSKYVSRKFGEDYERKLLYENPMHVIQNEYI